MSLRRPITALDGAQSSPSAPAEEPPGCGPRLHGLPQPIQNYACGLSTARRHQSTAAMAVLFPRAAPLPSTSSADCTPVPTYGFPVA